MRLSAKIFYNIFIQIVSKIIATVLGLLAIAIITRELGLIGFGQYTTIITWLSFFAILADFGLTLVTAQMISQPGADEKKLLNNLLGFRLVLAIALLGLAPIIILFFPYSHVIKLGVLITTLSFFFIALNQVLVGLFQKKLRMDKVSLAEVISRVILLVGVILAVKLGFSLIGILVATVVASAINFLLLFIFARSFTRLRLEFDLSVWKEIARKSWPLALTIALNLIYLKADTLILSLIKSEAEVGIYGAAYKVIDVLITIPFMFAGIVLPIMTFNWLKHDTDTLKKVLQKSFDFMIILALPLIVGTQFMAHEIMTLIAGEEFFISGLVLKILIIAAGLIFLGTIFSHAIIAVDKQKKLIGAYVFTSITALIGYFIFIPRFSYFGAAWVTVYSELVIALAAIYYTWKYTGFCPKLGRIAKAGLASLIMGLILYYLPDSFYESGFSLLFTLCAISVVYFVSLFALGGINKKEIAELLNRN